MLFWMIFIAEPFVTKHSMVRRHDKPERHMRKMVSLFKVKVTVTEFWFMQSNMTISIICSELVIFFLGGGGGGRPT